MLKLILIDNLMIAVSLTPHGSRVMAVQGAVDPKQGTFSNDS